jgi:hypothetical protein
MALLTLTDAQKRSYVEVPSGVAQQVTSSDSLLQVLIDEASGTITYVGDANPGIATATAEWRIQKINTSSNPITVLWADGNTSFDNVWDNRASLSYS